MTIDIAAGDRTLIPVDQATQKALKAFEGDSMGRVLVRPADSLAIDSEEWVETTDLLTGKAVAVRRADCGAGCRCAAEVKLVPSEDEVIWAPPGKAPAELVAGVNWWLNSDPAHAEDVVAMTEDNQDALILTGFNDVYGVVWVDPAGRVRQLKGQWTDVHEEPEEEA